LSQIKGETKDHVEKTISELKGQASSGAAPSGQTEKQISEIQAQLAQIKGERVNVQLSEIRGQLKKVTTQLSESKGPTDSVTRTELEAKVAATKGHVDKKINEINENLSKMKGEQDAALSKLKGPGVTPQMEKQISDLQAQVSQVKGERVGEQMSEMRSTMKTMMTQLSERKAPADSVTRSDLESIKDATKEHLEKKLSELQGQSPGTKEQVEKQIADLNAQVSQMKSERLNDQLSEMRGTIKKVMVQLSERPQADVQVTPRDLEDIKASTLSEVRGTKELVDKKVAELQAHLSQIQGQVPVTKEQVEKQLSDLNAQVSQMKGERVGDQLSEMRSTIKKLMVQLTEKSQADVITRSDLEAMRAATISELKGNGSATSDGEVSKQISDLSAQLSQMKGERVGDQLSEMRGTVKKLMMQLSEKNQADFITRSDLEATRAAILSEVRVQGEAPKENQATETAL